MVDSPMWGVQVACELAQLGADLVAQQLRRTNPDVTEEEVAARVDAWWSDRPGAPDGDSVGRRRDVAVE